MPAPIDLASRAYREMREEGFEPNIPSAVESEMRRLPQHLPADRHVEDLRHLPWTSIDNSDSRDLDQLEVVDVLPDGRTRLLVAIADVAAYVPLGSATDDFAHTNTTSVYTGVVTFPMLPHELSTDLTSLLQGVDRLAIVTDFDVDRDGKIESTAVYPAIVHNYARLDYDSLGDWIEGEANVPEAIAHDETLIRQIQDQHDLAKRLQAVRQRNGSLDFSSIEANPIVRDGQVVGLAVPRKNQARMMIENFMVAANMALAGELLDHGIPTIQRVVRTPERWDRIVSVATEYGTHLPAEPNAKALSDFLHAQRQGDPLRFPDLSLTIVKLMGAGDYALVRPGEEQGHFGLAVSQYTHSTAPNRRYVDLVTQRIVKARLAGDPEPYSLDELEAIAEHCNERETASRKVERRMRKLAAVNMLHDEIGRTFDAIVTGSSPKGVYVRVISPPVEGRVVRNEASMDVGDRVRVRLVSTDAERGFIDFEGMKRT